MSHGRGEQGRPENHCRGARTAHVDAGVDRPGRRVHIRTHDGYVPGAQNRDERDRHVVRSRRPNQDTTHSIERGRPRTMFVQRTVRRAREAGLRGRRPTYVQTDEPARRGRRRRALRVRGHRDRALAVRMFSGVHVEGRGQQQPRQRVRGQRHRKPISLGAGHDAIVAAPGKRPLLGSTSVHLVFILTSYISVCAQRGIQFAGSICAKI